MVYIFRKINRDLEKKLVRAPVREKLDKIKRCSFCKYNFDCCFIPESQSCKNLLEIDNKICKECGWRLADPDPCEGCIAGEFYTEINHQYNNEI